MNSPEQPLAEITLVETTPGTPAHDLFAACRNPESDEVYRTIWADFCAELIPRMEALGRNADVKLLGAELHALRGMSAQFGLFLLEIYLFAWESRSANPRAEIPRLLPAALVIAKESLMAIEQAFPYLISQGSTS